MLEDTNSIKFKLSCLDNCTIEELTTIINYSEKVKELKQDILLDNCPFFESFKSIRLSDIKWGLTGNPEELKSEKE